MIAPGRRSRTLALVSTLALALACSESGPSDPIAVRAEAALHIEPSRMRPGDLATLEIDVRTPPDQHLAPWRPPESADLWILGVESLPVERGRGQWLHALRVRLRPRALGVLHWPDSEIVVVDALDRETRVPLPGLDFEVSAPPPALTEVVGPYGMLRPEPDAGGGGSSFAALLAAAAGAGLALAAASAWRRWRLRATNPPISGQPPARDLFDWALGELAEAGARAESGPLEAARRTARTLRAFVARRYEVDVRARTTPELAGDLPPFAARSRWPTFLRLLRDLDEIRFRSADPTGRPTELSGRARRSIAECRRFVEDARPGGGRRAR